ncbi:MarR family transcriptional regulator [Lachnospiraceae bacterium]|nr:MarR family transcriptional regulator [Lachnospiraceae bacterium]
MRYNMEKKKKEVRYSSREVDILYILWNAGKPMLASEILAADEKLKPATVNTALKKMLEKELVVVADFVKSGNVYGRRYKPTITLKDFEMQKFSSTAADLVTALSRNTDTESVLEELDNLELIIKKQREKILKKK